MPGKRGCRRRQVYQYGTYVVERLCFHDSGFRRSDEKLNHLNWNATLTAVSVHV